MNGIKISAMFYYVMTVSLEDIGTTTFNYVNIVLQISYCAGIMLNTFSDLLRSKL